MMYSSFCAWVAKAEWSRDVHLDHLVRTLLVKASVLSLYFAAQPVQTMSFFSTLYRQSCCSAVVHRASLAWTWFLQYRICFPVAGRIWSVRVQESPFCFLWHAVCETRPPSGHRCPAKGTFSSTCSSMCISRYAMFAADLGYGFPSTFVFINKVESCLYYYL